jgi:hypothetical protein
MVSTFSMRRTLIPAAISFGLLAFLVGTMDLSEIRGLVSSTSPAPLAVAFALLLASNLVQAIRWQLVLRAWGRRQPLWALISIVMAGNFVTLLLPSAAGGDMARWSLLGRRSRDRATSAQSVMTDRLLGLATLGGLLLLGLPGAWPTLPGGAWRWSLLFVVPITLLGIAAALDPRWLPTTMRDKIGVTLAEKPRWVGIGAFMALVNHAAVVGAFVMVGRAVGDQTAVSIYATFLPIVWLASMAPVSFGGMGVREASFVGLFSAAGMASGTAVVIAGLWLVLSLVNGALGGLFLALESLRDQHPAPGEYCVVAERGR